MPTYTFKCQGCGREEDHRTSVYWRDLPCTCGMCGGEAHRVFTPTVNLIVPGHFMLDRSWAEPPPGDPAWENMSPAGARGGIHTQRTPSLKDEFDKIKQWG